MLLMLDKAEGCMTRAVSAWVHVCAGSQNCVNLVPVPFSVWPASQCSCEYTAVKEEMRVPPWEGRWNESPWNEAESHF